MIRTRTGERRRGGAVVELAVVLPFLIYLAVIGADWARLFYYTISCEGCARAGAVWCADTTTQSESGYTNVTDAARAASPNLGTTPNVSSATSTVNGRKVYTVTVTMTFKTITNLPGVPKTNTVTRVCEMREFPVTPD